LNWFDAMIITEPAERNSSTLSVTRRWPLVGREHEVSHFAAATQSDQFRGIVLYGGSGVGKTRLAHEYMRMLSESGFTTLSLTATAASAEFPLGLFLPLLSHPVSHPGPQGSLEQLQQCLTALTSIGAERRLGLLLDNADLVDQSSAFVLQMLSESTNCLFVATVHENLIRKVPAPLSTLWKDDGVEFLNLPRLSELDIKQVVASTLDGPVDSATTAKLNQLSQGNLFFLRELITANLRDGHFRQNLDSWHLIDTPVISKRLEEMVEDQLTWLTEKERGALEYVSVGEPISRATLESLCNAQHIESLESRGVITSTVDHGHLQYRVTHPLHAELVRRSTPALRAREISLALTKTAGEDGTWPVESLLRSSAWSVDSGDPELIFFVAKAARARREFERAQELAYAAANFGRNFEINCFLAEMASLQGDRATAIIEIANALNSAESDDQLFALASAILDNCLYLPETLRQTISLCSKIQRSIADSARRNILSDRLRFAQASMEGVDSMAEKAAAVLTQANAPQLAWAAVPASYALAHLGKFGRAHEIVRKGRIAHRMSQASLDQPASMYEYVLTEISAVSGRVERAYSAAVEQYELSVADESLEGQCWSLLQMSKMVGDRGYPRTSVMHARSAVLLSDKLGRHYLKVHSRACLSLALALCGKVAEAKQMISALDTSTCPPWESALIHVEAWVIALSGDVPEGLVLLNDGMRRCSESGDIVNESAIIHSIARLGQPHTVRQRLTDLAAGDEGTLITARAEHVHALVSLDPHALERAATAFERCGAWLLALEALADSVAAHQKRDQPSQAIAVAHRALALKQRCENPETPALRVLDQVPRLTKSEFQVATLAARSNTNKEIADHLCVSPRTVENHLRQVYRKLAIRGREELCGLIGEN
jgi:DNA-binding CsgD family transcriptional regulator